MRWVKRILLILLILVLGATGYGVFTVRRSFPKVDGEVEVDGLRSGVEILRDDLGVPHIYASNPHDLFFAQGYTHAQDRFWQMDFWRHIGSGRLSELLGDSQVETDEFLRSLGFVALAEQEWRTMSPLAKDVLQSYTDGVNAYLTEARSGANISLEYSILPLQNPDYTIELWSPIDSLTWAKVMSWDLSGNMRAEIDRAVLGQDLPPERVAQLYPPFPDDKPVIVGESPTSGSRGATADLPHGAIAALQSAGEGARGVWSLTGGGFDAIGSNNWVIGGDLTASGKPLLANDTHLAIQMPSIWYENGLHCIADTPSCQFQLVGFTFPGTPGVVIGHNQHHAWGVTTEAADTQDLYIEKVNPQNPNQYEVDGEWVDFEVRTETIEVAGGEDVTFDVRTSRHGPVISGTFLDDGEFDGSTTVDLPGESYVVSLAWQSLEPSTLFEAIVGIDLAQSYDTFLEAVSLWDIAAQNIVYADVDGNIAYHATGEIPIRAAGDGLTPVPGWTSDNEWVGIVPFDEMPSLFNPGRGYIVTANQPVLTPGEQPLIGIDGAYGYRAARVGEMISTGSKLDLEAVQAMQMDGFDGSAQFLVPYLLDVATDSPNVVDLQERLTSWASGGSPYQVTGASSGASVYLAIWQNLLSNVFDDELPDDRRPDGGSRWFEVVRHLLETPDDPWWDDIGTTEVESRDDILLRSMLDAYEELSSLRDRDSGWQWGHFHIARFENQTLGQSGVKPIEWLFNRKAPERVGGSDSIVNATGWDPSVGFEVDWVPSQRMVIDLASFDDSTFVHTTGQSGHAFHQQYESMIEMWTDGLQAPMPWSRSVVEDQTTDVLTLIPATASD